MFGSWTGISLYLIIFVAVGTAVVLLLAVAVTLYPDLLKLKVFNLGGSVSVRVTPEGEDEDWEEDDDESHAGWGRDVDVDEEDPELDSKGEPVPRKLRQRRKRINEEQLEALCARSGFTADEVLRLHQGFVRAGRGRDFVDPKRLIAELPFLAGPVESRMPRVLKIPEDKPINFMQLVTSLSTFCERTPADDKVKLLFRLCDADGDGKIDKDDLCGLLDLILPASEDAEERRELLDHAVSSCMEELSGSRGESSSVGLEQFASVVADLAGERGTIFF